MIILKCECERDWSPKLSLTYVYYFSYIFYYSFLILAFAVKCWLCNSNNAGVNPLCEDPFNETLATIINNVTLAARLECSELGCVKVRVNTPSK